MSALGSINDASKDQDLIARFEAAAAEAGVASPAVWVSERTRALAAAEATTGQTIADVYAYAVSLRNAKLAEVPDLPGRDPNVVLDDHIRNAVAIVIAAQVP